MATHTSPSPSFVKGHTGMRAPHSLYNMARRFLQKRIHEIYDIGDVPFDTVKPVLMKITDAEQLKQLEENCPQLEGHTGEIWQKIIHKEFGSTKNVDLPPIPDNPESWSAVYDNYRRIVDKRIKAAEADLKSLFHAVDASRQQQAKLMVTDRAPIKPGRARRFAGPAPKLSPIAAITGKGPQRRDLLRPAHTLSPTRASGVTAAPKSMLPPPRSTALPRSTSLLPPRRSILPPPTARLTPTAPTRSISPRKSAGLIGPLGAQPGRPARPAVPARTASAGVAAPKTSLPDTADLRSPPAPKTWGARKLEAEHAAKKEETRAALRGAVGRREPSPAAVARRRDGSPVVSLPPGPGSARKRKRDTILVPNKRLR